MLAIIPKQFSGLRFKVLSAIAATFLVLFVSQFTAARIILLNSYTRLSQERARSNATQVQNALSQRISELDTLTSDWAEWDDTYQFVEDGNQAFIVSNLVDDSFLDFRLNVLLIINRSGQIVYGQGFDWQNQHQRELPPDLVALISQKQSPLLNDSTNKAIKGIVLLTEGPMLVSARSILTSEGKGPLRGTLIMGRFLDRTEIEILSNITQVPIESYLYQDPQLPADIELVKTQLSKNLPIAVRTVDNNAIASYLLLDDIAGKPILIWRTKIDSNIYSQAQTTYFYYFWTTLAIGLVFCGLSWLLLEKLILSRLGKLTQDVSLIGSSNNLSLRVFLPGRDELSGLANTLNLVLEKLQQSQQALQESEERYSLAVTAANDGVWDWNLLTYDIYLSPRWKAIIGYEDNEIENDLDEWFKRIHPEDVEPLKWGLQIHLESQTPYLQYEYQMQHKDGTYRWVLCRGLAVRDENGNPYRIAGSLSDITERKLAETSLAQRTVELARSNAELEQFAYVASHDLQEPLRKIEAFGDRLKVKCAYQLSEQGQDYLTRMQKSAQRMRTLIEDLLTFSRITTKATPFVAVNLNEVISDVISDLEVRIQKTNGRIEVSELPTIKADPLQTSQLFQNLLGNALKFHRPEEPPVIKVTGKKLADEQYQISVTDNGIGFEEQYCDRIFQVFQRLHGRSEYEGTGIGLAVCAKIVARHGGLIAANSTPGRGATFIITLPLSVTDDQL
jgi:PAS domain S-box-containing protein